MRSCCGRIGRFEGPAWFRASWFSAYSFAPAKGCDCASLSRRGPEDDAATIGSSDDDVDEGSFVALYGVGLSGCTSVGGSETLDEGLPGNWTFVAILRFGKEVKADFDKALNDASILETNANW